MVDKNYCMSSYLALRYIERDDMDFYPGTHHRNAAPLPDAARIPVKTAGDIDREIGKQFEALKGKKLGVMLSGGNAFTAANLPYYDPYARLKMAEPLDLYRVRHGEPKYLIRELMASKYPDIPVPDKIPMPRPVDSYFKDWRGPTRPEFKESLYMGRFSGNQKWQMWCLERFLDINEP